MRRLDIDRAVFFSLGSRIWSLFTGPVTVLLIAARFTPELQGYYYTFASLVALQSFVELGFNSVLIQFASHEWAKLGLDSNGQIVGDTAAISRLASLARLAMKWFLTGGALVVVGLSIAGYQFFVEKSPASINWRLPWFALCAVTGLTLFFAPIWALLEGCNQVTKVYGFRFFQNVVTSLALWIAIAMHGNLWAASAAGVAGLACDIAFLRGRYWGFLKSVRTAPKSGESVDWRREFLPIQSRMAVSVLGSYFWSSTFVPVLFKFWGPAVAGQMGMTLALTGALSSIAGAWIPPRVPSLGMLIARREYAELDRRFWRLAKMVMAVAILGAASIWLLIVALYWSGIGLAARVLPPLPTALFLTATVLSVSTVLFASYMRAHRKEPLPLVASSVIGGALVCLSNIILGKYFGAVGVASGYLAIMGVLVPVLALTWHRTRIVWHSAPVPVE